MSINRDEKILVVDDEQSIRELIVTSLEDNGYLCSTAADGQEALRKLEEEDYQLVISDIKMPGMDGIELLKRILSEYRDVAVIMVTSLVNINYSIEAMKLGAYDYILKPFDLGSLLISVQRAFERRMLIIKNREYQYNLELKVEEQTREIRKVFLNAIEALAQALEAKDAYTSGHSHRVTEISVIIAKELEIDSDYVDKIRLSGLLHDIGKIGIRGDVLNKPGRLTESEYKHVSTHPSIGVKILQFLIKENDVIEIIKHHHEFYNGKGLPDGLRMEKIPIGSRILAVADTFDAMTSTRPYRNALSPETAYKELERCKGTQFDPDVVDAFFRCREKVERIISGKEIPLGIAINQ